MVEIPVRTEEPVFGGWWAWLPLAMLLVLLPPYVVFLGRPAPVRSMESICVHTSLETWVRQRGGEADAWWSPSWRGGVVRIEKPPLLVWLNMAAWSGLDPGTATMEQLAFRARMITVLLTCIGLLAVYWIGLLLHDRWTGCLAALIGGTCFLTIKQTHYATYDSQLMGWTTLAVAFGIRAMIAPGRVRSSRRLFFWLLCGLAFGGALMTKGPVGAVWIIVPLLLFLLFGSRNPRRDLLGILLASLAAGALMAPWTMHAMAMEKEALHSLASEYRPVDVAQFRPVYRYLALVGLVFPWTFWWLPAFASPFAVPAGGRARFFPLAWFAATFLFVAAWPMRHERYLVPLVPVVGLMCAAHLRTVILEHRWTRGTRRLLVVFWVLALLLSVALPLFVTLQPQLLARGLVDEIQFAGVGAWASLAAAGVMAGLAIRGLLDRKAPLRFVQFIRVALWMVVLATYAYSGYSLAEHQFYEHRGDAEALGASVGDTPVYHFEGSDGEQPAPLHLGFRIYARRVIPTIGPEAWTRLQETGEAFFVLAPADLAQHPPPGHEATGHYTDDDRDWVLFKRAIPR